MKKIFKIIGICIIVLLVLFMGLSETDIIELLGEPKFKSEGKRKTYTYSAGTTVKKSILVGEYQPRFYDLQINFDENNKVNYTGIIQIP